MVSTARIPLLPLTLLLSIIIPRVAAVPSNAVVSTITVSAPVSTSTSFTSDDAFSELTLAAHNFYRTEHAAANLTWNDTSAQTAADWSAKCQFEHSGGPTGENLSAGYANASQSVDTWGLEREHYNWKKPGFSESTGHFTQLVWSNTTSVGCARTNCSDKNGTPGWYVVCEYWPPGNILGENNLFFQQSVGKQVEGHLSDTVESGVTSEACGRVEGRWVVGVVGGAALLGALIAW